ncbi:MAG: methyltransferase domain-containing protein [Anaerolineales bacterium]|nr:methyltransferase domain-containing protein [Anaerolineales bacterium]
MSRVFGLDRGPSIDRYYIERFLAQNAPAIVGRVLEIGDDTYTRQFGGSRVLRSDVLHAVPGNERATVVADLAQADNLATDVYDCIICTQTLQCIYDIHLVVAQLHRILRPGGVLLATAPGISQVSRYDMDRWGDYWRFTTKSMTRLIGEQFEPQLTSVTAHGNVLVAAAFLYGLALTEMRPAELDADDPDYQLVITARAKKAGPA